jgi:hypothetical protein
MATIEDGIRARLASRSALKNLVGERIYPVGELPQRRTVSGRRISDALPPCVTFELNSFRQHTGDGYAGLTRTQARFFCYGENYQRSKQLADALIDGIDGHRGTWGADVRVSCCLVRDKVDIFDEPDDGSDRGVHWREVSADIWHGESAPSLS